MVKQAHPLLLLSLRETTKLLNLPGSRRSRWSPSDCRFYRISDRVEKRLAKNGGVRLAHSWFDAALPKIKGVKSRVHTESRPIRIFPKTVRLLFRAWFRT